MGKRVAGTCYLKSGDSQFSLAGSFTCSVDDYEREGLSGLSGVVGYKEMPRVPFIEGECFHEGLSLDELRAMTDVTVTAELADGSVHLLRNAWTKGAHEFNGAEGTTTIRFEGISGEQLKKATA